MKRPACNKTRSKGWTVVCLILSSANLAVGQQYSPRTQFYETRLAMNPAVAGSDKEINVTLNFRNQWSGIDDAPSTQALCGDGFAGRNVGLGMVLYNDVAGPARNTGLQSSVARHFAIDAEGKNWISFGLSLILYQFKFDLERLKTEIPNDPAVLALARQDSRLSPDVAAGFYLSNELGFAGVSCQNMIQTKSDILALRDNRNTIERAYYLMGGYRFPVNETFSVEPLALIKVTEAKAWQADIMVKGHFSNYWAGLSYRTGDAVAVLLGLRLDMFSVSYSYDYPVSEIGSYNHGTHELSACVHIFSTISRYGPLDKQKQRPKPHQWRKRGRR